jgi:hypothetical protein
LAASYIATINNFFFREQNNYTRNLTGTKYILKFWDLAAMGIRLIHMCWRNRIIRHQQCRHAKVNMTENCIHNQASFEYIYIYIYIYIFGTTKQPVTGKNTHHHQPVPSWSAIPSHLTPYYLLLVIEYYTYSENNKIKLFKKF